MKFLFGATIGAVTMYAILQISSDTQYTQQISSVENDAAQNKELLLVIETLKAENGALRDQVIQLTAVISKPSDPQVNEQTAHRTPSPMPETDDLARLKALEAEIAFKNAEQKFSALEQKHNVKAQDAIAMEFDQEPINEEWAFNQQTRLDTQFDNDSLLSQTSLVASECRKTQCKVSLLQSPEQDKELSIHTIFSTVNTDKQWAAYISTVDPETGITDIYFQKEEHMAEIN